MPRRSVEDLFVFVANSCRVYHFDPIGSCPNLYSPSLLFILLHPKNVKVVMCSNCARVGVIESPEVITNRSMFYCSCGSTVSPATPEQLLAALFDRGRQARRFDRVAGGLVYRPRGASQQASGILKERRSKDSCFFLILLVFTCYPVFPRCPFHVFLPRSCSCFCSYHLSSLREWTSGRLQQAPLSKLN